MSTSQRPSSWAIGKEVHLEPNKHLCDLILMLVLNETGDERFAGTISLFTEFDLHANMVVVGKQAFVFGHSSQYANVQVFADKVKGL